MLLWLFAFTLASALSHPRAVLCPKAPIQCCRDVRSEWGLLRHVTRCGGTQSFPHSVVINSSPPNPARVGMTYVPIGSSSAGLSFSITSQTTAVCTKSGATVTFVAAGTCQLRIYSAGNFNYVSAVNYQSFTVQNKLSQSISFGTPPSRAVGSALFTMSATATSGLPVTLTSLTTSRCRIQNGNRLEAVSVGSCQIRATQSGNSHYNGALSVTRTSSIVEGSHVITLTSTMPTNARVQGTSYVALASSSRAQAITYSSLTTAVCTLSGSRTFNFRGTGTCRVRAFSNGGSNYVSDSDEQAFTVGRGSQSISFSSTPPSGATVGGSYTVSATSSALYPTQTVSFSTQSATICTVTGTTVNFVNGGTCRIRATVAQSANYNAVTRDQVFGISLTPQSLTISSQQPAQSVVFGTRYQASGTATSGLPVQWSTANPAICTVSATGLVSFTGSGSCTLRADQDGVNPSGTDFNAAAQRSQTWTVVRATQTITWSAPPPASPTYQDASVTLGASASSTLPVDFSSLTPTTCSLVGSVLSFAGAGTCTVRARQAGTTATYAPVTNDRTVTVAKKAQTVTFTTTPQSVLLQGTGDNNRYSPDATASSGLAVSFVVDATSSTVCADVGGATFNGTTAGVCLINSVQNGNANWLAAPAVQQTFEFADPASDAALFACDSPATCNTVVGNVLGPALVQEAVKRGEVEAAVAKYANCSVDPWLSTCNMGRIQDVFALNAERVALLQALFINATSFNASCATDDCRLKMQEVFNDIVPVAEAASTSCNTQPCAWFASGQAEDFKARVAAGEPGALAAERVRFDAYVQSVIQQQLEQHTFVYAQCTDEACRKERVQVVNSTFAKLNLLAAAKSLGIQVSNEGLTETQILAVNSNFTKCALSLCTIPEFNAIYRTKRAALRFLTVWVDRLQELRAACTSATCGTEVGAALRTAEHQRYLMTDYLPSQISVPGLFLFSLILVATVVIGVLGCMWRTVSQKEFFWLVLAGVFITGSLRIAFWVVGNMGVGTISLPFVILDKMAALFFALTILIFVFMWARATAILLDASYVGHVQNWVVIAMGVTTIAIACAVTGVTIYYALSISRDWVQAFYGEFVVDMAELILAAFTFAVVVALFVLILVVGFTLSKLRETSQLSDVRTSDGGSSGSRANLLTSGGGSASGGNAVTTKVDEKLKNLRIIAIAVGIMVLFLLVRFVLVTLRNFLPGFSLGYLVFYLVATLIPEVFCCAVMLGIVLFTFYLSRATGKLGTSTSTTARSYGSGGSLGKASGVEMTAPSAMARYEDI